MKTLSEYVKLHHNLLISIGILLVIVLGYSKIINYLEHRDQLEFQKAQIALQAQIDQNKQLAASVREAQEHSEQIEHEYKVLLEQLTIQNRAILQAQVKRDSDLKIQQQKDRNLPPPELAGRWSSLLNQPSVEVTPTEDGYQIKPGIAVETVVQLERIPQLEADLKDEQQLVLNKDKQIDNLNLLYESVNNVNTTFIAQVFGLRAQIEAEKNKSDAEISLLKAQSRKSKLKWFVAGYVAGFVSKIFIHF